MEIGFDVISDLNLSLTDTLAWEGKATSLYCIVAGNISKHLRVIHQTLLHLARVYQGVFYVGGNLEYEVENIDGRTTDLVRLCRGIRNVAFLHHHVVIIDGVAVLGATGWFGKSVEADTIEDLRMEGRRFDDITYLGQSIEKLQLHQDVRRIIVVTSSVPNKELYFGQAIADIDLQLPLTACLASDTEHKISHWVFGSYDKTVDINMNQVTYINNASHKQEPYWPKRVAVSF